MVINDAEGIQYHLKQKSPGRFAETFSNLFLRGYIMENK